MMIIETSEYGKSGLIPKTLKQGQWRNIVDSKECFRVLTKLMDQFIASKFELKYNSSAIDDLYDDIVHKVGILISTKHKIEIGNSLHLEKQKNPSKSFKSVAISTWYYILQTTEDIELFNNLGFLTSNIRVLTADTDDDTDIAQNDDLIYKFIIMEAKQLADAFAKRKVIDNIASGKTAKKKKEGKSKKRRK